MMPNDTAETKEAKTDMQAMLAIIQSRDADAAVDELKRLNLPCLLPISSSGGFLRESNTALLMAIPPRQLGRVTSILRKTCHRRTAHVPTYYVEASYVISAFPIEVEVGGATIFICDIERYEEY
jgi:uncharacterized protein YaaQ